MLPQAHKGMAFTPVPKKENGMVALRPPLKHRDFLKIDKDYEAAASAANLIYVTDKDAGIERIKKGKGFLYTFKGEPIQDEKDLDRIKKLVIPPAWTNVWISKSPNGHIQATGFDVAGRKQYRYHPRWSALQQETKFHRLIEFGKALPALRSKIQKDLSQEGFPESKVMAMMVSLMERTYIRVGNNGYEKLYGSYGITTLKNKHVSVKGNTVTFSFKGKKGVYHNISLKSKKFARIIKQCKAIPGRELFQYYDEAGNLKKVDSGQVNQYIKDAFLQDFTTKDFRTWAGTLMMLRFLKSAAPCETLTDLKKTVNEALKDVSKKLGNTVAVCKKYYVHPEVVELYLNHQLTRFFKSNTADKDSSNGLSHDEKVLMRIIKIIHREKTNPELTKKILKSAIQKESRKAKKRVTAA
jgi:DNA topoisomerase I